MNGKQRLTEVLAWMMGPDAFCLSCLLPQASCAFAAYPRPPQLTACANVHTGHVNVMEDHALNQKYELRQTPCYLIVESPKSEQSDVSLRLPSAPSKCQQRFWNRRIQRRPIVNMLLSFTCGIILKLIVLRHSMSSSGLLLQTSREQPQVSPPLKP